MSSKDPDQLEQDPEKETTSHNNEDEESFSVSESGSNENEAPVEPYDFKNLPEHACKSINN